MKFLKVLLIAIITIVSFGGAKAAAVSMKADNATTLQPHRVMRHHHRPIVRRHHRRVIHRRRY
ncbi:hypothetical protein [Mucilaginibacter sp.]|uniref:hypothetical protein n=1 Tax=Mucilaginibacter sp. TaxID=1882438 RepID=UPI003D127080